MNFKLSTKLSVLYMVCSILVLFMTLFFPLTSNPQPIYAFDITPPATVPQPVGTVAEADKATQNVYDTVVYLFFTVGSLGALLYTIWGAVEWITAGGDKDKLGAARKKISHALIGLVVLAFSFFIVYTVGKFIGINLVNLPPLKPLGNIR